MATTHTKGFIFDFDGVILDSATIKTEAFLELFSQYPEHLPAIESYHIKHQGITRFKKFEWIYRDLLSSEYTEEVAEELSERFSDIVLGKMRAADYLPGVMELLSYLREHDIPAFISSGTPDEELQEIIGQRDLQAFFHTVYGSDRTKAEAIDLIKEDFGFKSGELIFIGDAITDYEAANSRGVPFIAVYSEVMEGFWREKEIEPVHHLMEITERVQVHLV
ncbi:MAG TPA: HAD hydrolase-like protein [Balneolaceae bacterium]|nr:HAD hydrolase-like protein [Balneolaceae bacterium]